MFELKKYSGVKFGGKIDAKILRKTNLCFQK